MVQILPSKMVAVQKALREMKDFEILCGPVDGDTTQTEVVSVKWVENDTEFNKGYEFCRRFGSLKPEFNKKKNLLLVLFRRLTKSQ